MSDLICTIFNVEHGFAAFIRTPNQYGLLVDCGSRDRFSPIKWVKGHYNAGADNIQHFNGERIAECIITHLHADHFDDVGSFAREGIELARLQRDKQTMQVLEDKIREADESDDEKAKAKAEPLRAFKKFSDKYSEDAKDKIDWGCTVHWEQLSMAEAKEVGDEREHILNNRSHVITISYAGKKILLPGDIETDGWQKALTKDRIKKLLKGTTFFVASHHGHKSGWDSTILDATGLPAIFVVSAKRGDEHVASAYGQSENSKGHKIEGEKDASHLVSTRNGKSIEITISQDGSSSIALLETKDNLNENQARLRGTGALLARFGIHGNGEPCVR